MKALITGAGGFAGPHLARSLLRDGFRVTCLTRQPERLSAELPDAECVRVDLTDGDELRCLVRTQKPDQIFHLAAVTSEADLLADPIAAFAVNVAGTESLMAAVAHHAPDARVVLAGSSAEYGLVDARDSPVRESAPLRPVTLYGVSKVAQSLIGLRYWLTKRLRVVRTRAFNYAGPGQSDRFVIASVCRKLAEIRHNGGEPILRTGNLTTARDFLDVRDVAEAYVAAANAGQPGEAYNIATGRAHFISELVQQLVAMSEVAVEVESSSPPIGEATDVPAQVGDASRLTAVTGWRPRIPMNTTLQDTLADWRNRVRSGDRP